MHNAFVQRFKRCKMDAKAPGRASGSVSPSGPSGRAAPPGRGPLSLAVQRGCERRPRGSRGSLGARPATGGSHGSDGTLQNYSKNDGCQINKGKRRFRQRVTRRLQIPGDERRGRRQRAVTLAESNNGTLGTRVCGAPTVNTIFYFLIYAVSSDAHRIFAFALSFPPHAGGPVLNFHFCFESSKRLNLIIFKPQV